MYRTLRDIKKCEQCENGLVEAAVRCSDAKRFRAERNHQYRTPFARDRDRIIHSLSFQRLVNKTQLLPSADPSKYTTRLLHSIKVAQIAQTLARALRINEDLTEAIALGHDLGHAPFGHVGEDVLRELLIQENGFEHNEESVFVAVFFEPMNLTIQTLEGVLKHTRFSMKPYYDAKVERNNTFGSLRIPGRDPKTYTDPFKYWGGIGEDGKILFKSLASYEGQIVDVADEIAYISHDVMDLVSAGVIKQVELPEEWLTLFGDDPANAINELVKGVIKENCREIEKERRGKIGYGIKHPQKIAKLVETMKGWFNELYNKTEPRNARNIIIGLFNYFKDNELESYKHSVFGEDIVNRGFKGKLLAGHLLASLTDNEARKIHKEFCK